MAQRSSTLVCQYLEGISREALARYQDIIRDYIRGRHGIYALYRGKKLYYVGLASNLRGRLKSHLRNRHAESWDRFSIYLTVGDDHLRELESLLLRIVRPSGNKQIGKFHARCENIRNRFSRDVRRRQREEHDMLFGRVRRLGRRIRTETGPAANGGAPPLAAYVSRRIKLRRTYKGRLYRAVVRPDGRIRYNRALFTSPSGAASEVTGHPADGWLFWQYERAPGDWVTLDELRGKRRRRK